MKNIELFDEFSAFILAKLYDEFPLSVDFEIKEIYKNHANLDPAKLHKIAINTLLWLKNNGFVDIYSLDISGTEAISVTLSLKGLELLRQKPLKLDYTLGQNLQNAFKFGTKESVKKAIDLILEKSLNYIFKE